MEFCTVEYAISCIEREFYLVSLNFSRLDEETRCNRLEWLRSELSSLKKLREDGQKYVVNKGVSDVPLYQVK